MKNLIVDVEYVTCPYCGSDSKHYQFLVWRHLATHGKKLEDVRREFPNHPTMTKKFDDQRKEGSRKSAQTHNQPKKIQCIHCGCDMWVKKNESNKQACGDCLSKGLENPDGRTKPEAQQKRVETFKRDYGVENPQQIEAAKIKASKTFNEKHGGRGFASKKLAKRTRKVIKERFGAENIMQTEEGYAKFIAGLQKRYGKDITNAQHVFEIRRRTTQTLIEKFKKEDHHTKGKNYIEMYGKEAADKLIELRRKSGAKGFKKSLEMGYGPSKPQLEIFKLIKEIIPEAKLEFGQNLLYDDKRYYYFLDIAIPDLKINIEYDCAWTHPDPEKDKFRDEVLSSFGWKTIRYFEKIPTKEELEGDINKLIQ